MSFNLGLILCQVYNLQTIKDLNLSHHIASPSLRLMVSQ